MQGNMSGICVGYISNSAKVATGMNRVQGVCWHGRSQVRFMVVDLKKKVELETRL